MSAGLIALLDDVAMIARAAAASVDDVAAYAGKATAKSAGVVIDDAAVTPGYVLGFAPERELPLVRRIALGSLRNKLLILLPLALLLSAFAPWVVAPLLLLGGIYLSLEGTEKVLEALSDRSHAEDVSQALASDPVGFEDRRAISAIRTDFILSAEIMAIALASVTDAPIPTQAIVLAIVGVVITVGVYGAVALIVKADDVGLRLAGDADRSAATRALGRRLVAAMPSVLAGLTVIGTAAMIWVGGSIVVHAAAHYGLAGFEHAVARAAHAAGGGVAGFAMEAAAYGVAGLLTGLAALAGLRIVRPGAH